MTKISVIVPVYNVEDYLEKCLNSLINQTFKDIEIILVNDGSTDNSQKIIDKYKKKYKNIVAIKKENGGQGSARNYGIEIAKGEYISFIDSDDYIELDMFEKMYNKMLETNYDIVICKIANVYPDGNRISGSNINIDSDITDRELIKKHMINIYPIVVNKLYKKDIFIKNDIKFKEKVWFEDVELLHRLVPYVNSIGFVDEELYNYYQRGNSVTNTFNNKLYDYIDNWNDIISFYKKRNLFDEYKCELEYCYVRYLYATFIKRAAHYDSIEYKKAVNSAIKNVKENFPGYRKNSYFYKSIKGLYLICFNKFVASVYKWIGGK